MKIFYFDVETTGLFPWKHGIVQLAYVIEVDFEEKESGSCFVRPFDSDEIDPKALAVNGLTKQQLDGFPEPTTFFSGTLLPLLAKYVDKYDKNDKFCPAGFNTQFDVDFLQSFFKKNGDKYYGSWFNYDIIDPLQALRFFQPSEEWIQKLPDKKLGTVAKHFGINLDNAHEALADIQATRELVHRLWNGECFNPILTNSHYVK